MPIKSFSLCHMSGELFPSGLNKSSMQDLNKFFPVGGLEALTSSA